MVATVSSLGGQEIDPYANALFRHWQLGEKDKAREWFAKAVRWMEKGNQEEAELKRFRAEAAELLGMEEPM